MYLKTLRASTNYSLEWQAVNRKLPIPLQPIQAKMLRLIVQKTVAQTRSRLVKLSADG